MATASIPVITNAAAPEVDTDQVGQILKLLDETLALYERSKSLAAIVTGYYQVRCDRLVTLFEDRHPHAEYAIRLWASAKGFSLDEHVHSAPEYRQLHRVVGVVVDKPAIGSPVVLMTLHGKSLWRDVTFEQAPSTETEVLP